MVHGSRAQAEALREETAGLLASQGLRLSMEKTHITHVDRGFDFLGFRIQRRPRAGKTPCASTFMSKANFAAIKRKVKAWTRRNRLNLSLQEILEAINPILRGVAYYFQHAAVKRTLHYLTWYSWWRVMRWIRAKHPKASWTWLRKRFFGKDKMRAVEERVSDQAVLTLLRAMPRAGVMEGGQVRREVTRAPQGGPASPVLANVVLHRLDREWAQRYSRLGVLVRYTDDECICCPTRERAEAAMAALADVLAGLGLSLAAGKTRIVCVADGTGGYDFLGFHHRMVPSRRNPRFRYPACWPSAKAVARARGRIRELTGRNRRHVPTHLLVSELNQFLRGWRQYYRYGNSSRSFAKLDRYTTERMALLLSKRHGKHGRGNGMKHVIMSGNRLGLVSLAGNVEYGRLAHAGR
jgi:RNA-directed DNA polymerase